MLPCPIDEDNVSWVGNDLAGILLTIKYFVVERAKTARRFIKMMQPNVVIQELIIDEFDKQDASKNLTALFQPLLDGHDLGLMSEAGNPCIADPGSLLVAMAHKKGIEVKPFIGPSSILLALISSGFNGQNFIFHGYLSNKKEILTGKLKTMESYMQKTSQTQVFMETPYRNEFMIEILRSTLSSTTLLCVATDIGGKSQSILTKTIAEWKKVDSGNYHKRPTIFLIGKQ